MDQYPLNYLDLLPRLTCKADNLRRISPELQNAGLAVKLGRDWRYSEAAVEYILSRPDKRGRPKKKK